MTAGEVRIAELYDVFNARDFDRFMAMLAPDVVWPDETEDRQLCGREAVRTYLLETTAPLIARYVPIAYHVEADGRVAALLRQLITSAADGSLWSSTRVLHRWTLREGLVARLEAQQDCPDLVFPGVDAMLARLTAALNAADVEGVLTCYSPRARFIDSFEDGVVEGEAGLRAHFVHLFETIRLELVVIGYALEADDRARVRLRVVARGPGGGLWQDDTITIWYRLEGGLIVEQDVDDSGRDGNGP
jgi:ketosteroid isomerase-like protein